MPNIVNVSADGSVSLSVNEWADPNLDPMVQEPGPQGGQFDLKPPDEPVAKPKRTARKKK